MRIQKWLASTALACCSMAAISQMQMGSGGAGSDPAKAEDVMMTQFEGELMGVVKAMPAEKFGFAPGASIFASGQPATFNGVRTFAQEATHIAQANYYFFSTFGGPKPTADMKAISALKTKEEIISALQGSFTYAHQVIATITPENAFQPITGADGMNTRATMASFAVAHGFDHYGQMVEYLRMNGILPPGSK